MQTDRPTPRNGSVPFNREWVCHINFFHQFIMQNERQLLRVLLIEDNENDAMLIRREIERSNGFDMLMERVETEEQVRIALHRKTWDIILCDFRLPKLDAVKVLNILETFSLDIPFILISGSILETDADMVLAERRIHSFIKKSELARLGPTFRRELRAHAAYNDTLLAWARALEFRDRETAGHSRRVTELTVRLARALQISETEIIHIRRGALLHDVGKMSIPDEVLFKTERLDDDEFEIIKRHPQIGYELLLPILFLRKSLDIPYCHHEKFDGSGYPRGLKGAEIPLAARIFSIVDVFDALTSNRPYRISLTPRRALEYIQSEAGRYFDPHIVDVFVEMMDLK